jgi:hypothetical protein
VLANVRALREPGAARQLWRVLAAADLDDRVHLTARHLVTKVASTVISDMRCPDIRATVAAGAPFDGDAFFYNSAFQARWSAAGDEAAVDRVASDYDPALTVDPRATRRLAFHLGRGAMDELLGPGHPPGAHRLAGMAAAAASGSVDAEPVPGSLDFRQSLIGLADELRRRLFFLSADHPLAPRLPLPSLDNFFRVARDGAGDTAATRNLLRSLNATLGVTMELDGLVVPRDYSRGLAGTGFALLVPETHFRLEPGTALGSSYRDRPFMASWPRSILLVATGHDGTELARLSVPLLMYEILSRAAEGFRPISQTERSYMVRLQGLYRALSVASWDGRASHVLYEDGRVVAKARFDRDAAWVGAA